MARRRVQSPYRNKKLTVCQRLQKFGKENGEWLRLVIATLALAVQILALVAFIVFSRNKSEPVRSPQPTSEQTEFIQPKNLEQVAAKKKPPAIIGKKITPQGRSR
jgi:hypothetical protein